MLIDTFTLFNIKMPWTIGYLDISAENICEYENHGPLVTSENVCLERRVCRGRHWNATKWTGDVDNDSNAQRGTVSGTIVGYVDDTGLVGDNVVREYNQVQQGQQDWCVVDWDNGKRSIYPIGANGIFALSFS